MEAGLDRAALMEKVRFYQGGNAVSSVYQFAFTFTSWALFYTAGLFCLARGSVLFLPFLVGSGIFTVRLFMIQHDCGHGSFFSSRRSNTALGRLISLVTFTPFRAWARSHAEHHRNSGNLSHRGIGDIRTLTVAEFSRLPYLGRLRYKAYRHPLLLIVIGPLFLFFIRQRLSYYLPEHWSKERGSIWLTNAALALVWGAATYCFPLSPADFILFLVGQMWIASSLGVWLFYVQHQFPSMYWAESDAYDPVMAALRGSSFYALPQWLHWLTAHIGYHHVHHLDDQIPNYRLSACHNDIPELQRAFKLTLGESLACLKLKLWDEEKQVMTTF